VVREFESEYPEIRIKSVHITGLNFEQKMVVEIAGNAGSDVFWWPYDPLPTMAEKGAFLDLGHYIEREKFDLDS
jgi:ABC-type glycerol-3-phosphate transport system substrate-binding protein